MAVNPKITARSATKKAKKAKMPKASTKDLKALEVADASPALIKSLFGKYIFGADAGYKHYKANRKAGHSMQDSFKYLWSRHDLETIMQNEPY